SPWTSALAAAGSSTTVTTWRMLACPATHTPVRAKTHTHTLVLKTHTHTHTHTDRDNTTHTDPNLTQVALTTKKTHSFLGTDKTQSNYKTQHTLCSSIAPNTHLELPQPTHHPHHTPISTP